MTHTTKPQLVAQIECFDEDGDLVLMRISEIDFDPAKGLDADDIAAWFAADHDGVGDMPVADGTDLEVSVYVYPSSEADQVAWMSETCVVRTFVSATYRGGALTDVVIDEFNAGPGSLGEAPRARNLSTWLADVAEAARISFEGGQDAGLRYWEDHQID